MPSYGFDIIESCTSCTIKGDRRFCDLPDRALQAFENLRYTTVFPEGTILFAEGHEPRGIFILCRGRVKLSFCSVEGKTAIMKIAESGEVLGLSATISGQPYLVTAETIESCQINFIKREDFLRFLAGHTEAFFRVDQQLAEKYSYACRDLRSFNMAQSAAEKVAKLLLSWMLRSGEAEKREPLVRLLLTQEEMGQIIAASRETVTRVLMEFKKRHIVRSKGTTLFAKGTTLIIHDKVALNSLANATEFIKLH
jgi:CRP/FNR family cyclic AMP-dependent transcriptional regulator